MTKDKIEEARKLYQDAIELARIGGELLKDALLEEDNDAVE